MAGIIGGASIVETIFAIPGIGSYAIAGVQSKDYYVVQAYVLFSGCIYVLTNNPDRSDLHRAGSKDPCGRGGGIMRKLKAPPSDREGEDRSCALIYHSSHQRPGTGSRAL